MEGLCMKPPPEKYIPASPEEWLTHAKSDLKFAKLGMNQDVLREQICFHAQQAVEKAVKSVLALFKVDFPFTHDIEELLDICEIAGILIPLELSDIGMLTPYAVESRYPGYWGEILENDVTEAIIFAEKTIKWAEDQIEKKASEEHFCN
ncbi:MAG: HEPN domain-containing protein [Candidatus Hydrogenedentota bacterium]